MCSQYKKKMCPIKFNNHIIAEIKEKVFFHEFISLSIYVLKIRLGGRCGIFILKLYLILKFSKRTPNFENIVALFDTFYIKMQNKKSFGQILSEL